MSIIGKRNLAQKQNQDLYRRVQTECGDQDDASSSEIQSILSKYKKSILQDSQTNSKRTSNILQKIRQKSQDKLKVSKYKNSRVGINQNSTNGNQSAITLKENIQSHLRKSINSQVKEISKTTSNISNNSNNQHNQNKIPVEQYTYNCEKVVGSGTFGVVYKARVNETGQTVAIKKVLQDKRYKNRELEILKMLNHQNVLKMIHAFFQNDDKKNETYLHVIMPYLPETLYSFNRYYIKQKQYIPNILVKIYTYQLLRSLAYIDMKNICHRDIKPHNILVDPSSNQVVMCDFGSAKQLIKGDVNISYICSRCYRAPELIFGATQYDNQIDMWSIGCVIAEMINGQPMFIADSAVDQLVEIIKVLGTPTKEQILSMNPQYNMNEFKFPQIKYKDWKKVLRSKCDPQAIDLVSKILVYSPKVRLNPLQALCHPYFDDLRDEQQFQNLQKQMKIPNLFDFTRDELKNDEKMIEKLIPDWVQPKQGFK